MNLFRSIALILLVCILFLNGCSNGVKVKIIESKPQPKAVDKLISLLERYADGNPPGSELGAIKALISDAKEQTPEKGDLVEEVVNQLLESPDKAKQIAKEVLPKLQNN